MRRTRPSTVSENAQSLRAEPKPRRRLVDRGRFRLRFDAGPSEPTTASLVFALPLALMLAIYGVVLACVPNGFLSDDTDLILFSQQLAWGYHEQPPLYSWMAWGVFRLFGVTHLALAVTRMLGLAPVFLVLYRCGRLLLPDRRWASLTAFGILLIPAFSWNSLAYLTDTNLACFGAGLILLGLLRLERRGRTRDYALLGVALGLGALAKSNVLLLTIALLGSGVSIASFRARLVDRRILLSLGLALAIVLPHYVWVAGHWSDLAAMGSVKAQNGARSIGTAVRGFWQFGKTLTLVLLPLLGGFAVLASAAFRKPNHLEAEPLAGALRLLERSFILSLGLIAFMMAACGMDHLRDRWLYPFLVLIPLYLLIRLRLASPQPVPPLGLTRLTFAAGVVLLVGWAGWLMGDTHRFGKYTARTSFREAAERASALVGPRGTIVTIDRVVAANLRYWLPEARVLCTAHPLFLPPGDDTTPSVFIWDMTDLKRPWRFVGRHVGEVLHRPMPTTTPPQVLSDQRRSPTDRRAALLAYLLLPPASR